MLDLLIEPALDIAGNRWSALHQEQPDGELFGRRQSLWREKTRRELGLATDRPVIATGHQTLLWHPGILAKYLVLHHASVATDCAMANLIVDQHVDRFGEFDVPIQQNDGTLATRRIELTPPRPDVPMGLQEPFDPPETPGHWPFALDSVRLGVDRIISSVRAHRSKPNAALQMAAALDELMSRWVPSVPNVTATDLGETTLAREMLARMVNDPHAMAAAYNRAVAAVPEAGIPPLLVRDDYVEVPLWRIRPDGRRMRAYDNDVQQWLDAPGDAGRLASEGRMRLLPRALFMTALVRLGMCDLFIHGTGGTKYDRAMEQWMRRWLGIEVAPSAVVSATLRLPLGRGVEDGHVESARHAARQAWHDPEMVDADSPGTAPGPAKAAQLDRIAALPRRSMERRAAYFDMHQMLARLRDERRQEIDERMRVAEQLQRQAESRAIADRRDWPFALYPEEMIDAFQAAVRRGGAVPERCR